MAVSGNIKLTSAQIGVSKVERHEELCMALNTLYAKKNHDYGDSFHEMFLEEGWASARIRLTDKLKRFKQLTKNPDSQQIKDESIRDTLIDLANYALMSVLELDESNEATRKTEGVIINEPGTILLDNNNRTAQHCCVPGRQA